MSNKKIKEEKDINIVINSNTYNLLFSDNENLEIEKCGSLENLNAYIIIDKFTMLEEKKVFYKILKKMYKDKLNIDLDRITFNKENKRYEYSYNGKIYAFSKLSDNIDSKKIKKELMSEKRYGSCHTESINLSLKIEDSYVLTGYIILGNKMYLHSVVETVEDDDTVIIDWTRNLKMLKDDYLKLTSFNCLSRVLGSDILSDYEKITNYFGIGVKSYLVFRDEIINELDKKSILKK